MPPYKPENVQPAPIPPSTLSHFLSIPWCATLLSTPFLQPIRSPSRDPKGPSSTEDSLVAETLQTSSTIPHWQTLFQSPTGDSATGMGEVTALLEFGAGLDGHAGVAHGGVLATVIDEVMGALVYLHLGEGCAAFTVEMKVGFRRVVRTPGAVAVRAWAERAEGRKVWVRAEVGDGVEEGYPAVVGEGLFVVVGSGGGAKI